MGLLAEAVKRTKGSEWEGVLYKNEERDPELVRFESELKSFNATIEETNEMIEANDIPVDEYWALRTRIKDTKDDLDRMIRHCNPFEDRMPLLQTIMDCHRAIFDAQSTPPDPDDAA